MKDAIILDTEFTAWEGSQERGWSEPWEHREIIQVGAIRINPKTFEDTREVFDVLIKPTINPELSDYITKLTSITNEDIAKRGVSFTDAAKSFHKYSDDANIFSFGGDCHVINDDIELHNLQKIVESFLGNDVRQWAIEQGIDVTQPLPDGRPLTSGTFAEAVGAPFKTEAHYALNDVLSIRAAVKYLVEEKGFPNPFLLD